VKKFAAEHFTLDHFVRVEWVDDTSANLIYESSDDAAQALSALTDAEMLNLTTSDIQPLQLRPAKRISLHPNSELFIRQGTTIDVKRKGAADASRYYLMNPNQDPRERRRPRDENRPRRRRYSDEDGDYNRRHFDDREHKRRRNEESGFDVSMYDDDAGDSDKKRTRLDGGGDLFADPRGRANGRLRNRSASPGRDRGHNARLRSISPSRNAGKELFPSVKKPVKELFPSTNNAGKDLFPSSPEPTKELFPSKQSTVGSMRMDLIPNKRGSFSNHRRSDAVDASASNDKGGFFNSTPPPRERSLAERITGRPSSAAGTLEEIRIRGAANSDFSIRGAAADQSNSKELFPLKAGSNVGKELFSEKIKGRGGPRRRAEDMFG
jgi:Nuclear cap-binding protein subunit 3